jgi:hypothetical protein
LLPDAAAPTTPDGREDSGRDDPDVGGPGAVSPPDAEPAAPPDAGAGPAEDAGQPDQAGAADATVENVAARLSDIATRCTKLVGHSYNIQGGTATVCAVDGALVWIADLEIDCDGRATPGKCDLAHDSSYTNETAYHESTNQAYAAAETPYIVIPGDLSYPGLKGNAVAAVIYKGKLTYAVVGDIGPKDVIGAASYACAAALDMNPSPATGGVAGKVVTYVTFLGDTAVPRKPEDASEVKRMGEALAGKLILANP